MLRGYERAIILLCAGGEVMNYKGVIEGFNNGTLNKDIIILVMDNDGGYWSVSTGSEEVDEILEERLEKGMNSERIQAPAKQMTAKEIEAFIIRHAS
ncbi:hypothetical protein [Vibrio phage S4-7]|nr:hypothetical protein [Vibrio phage S4-7]